MEFSDGKGNSVRPTSVTFPDAVFQNDPGGSTIYIKTGAGTGNGTPGSAGVAKFAADTYAAARGLAGASTGDTLYVFGRTSQSDGGQGLFTWVPGGTTTVNDGYALTATGGIWRRPDSSTLLADWFGVVGDNATDNGLMINAWIAAANELITGGAPPSLYSDVKMVLRPTLGSGGRFATTLRHLFPGQADVVFEGGTALVAIGSDETSPLMTHGHASIGTSGRLQGIAVDGNAIPTVFYNPEFIGVRLLNKQATTHEILFVRGFYRGVQLQGNTNYCSYNTVVLGSCLVNKEHVNFNSRDNSGSGFVSQNTIICGDMESTSSLNVWGSAYAWTFTEDWENAHAGKTGNFWYSPSCQLGNPANIWTGTTVVTTGNRLYTPKMGGEWLVKTGGTTGTVEPSILPTVVDKTNITVTPGSAAITMGSTTGIVAGMHMRGTNPAFAFPVDTYVVSNDSGTQVTLSHTAAAGSTSTTYHGSFVAATVDNTATLVYLGPYRRSPVWMRNAGGQNGMRDARWESGAGEALILSGTHLYPEAMTENLGGFTGTFEPGSTSVTAVNVCNAPTWTANKAYNLGDMVRPAVLGTVFWECIVAGTSTNGSEPVPSNSTAGSTFVDTGVTWLIRPIRNTQSNGDWGEYTGAVAAGSAVQYQWCVSISNTLNEPSNSVGVDNLHYRAIGSATGWRIKGVINSDNSGNLSTNFAAGDFALCRDGISHLTFNVFPGFILDTRYNKAFITRRAFGAYNAGRGVLIPLNANRSPLLTPNAQAAYHRRIQSVRTISGNNSYFVDSSDSQIFDQYMLVNDEVKYVFFGNALGAGITIAGLSVTLAPHRATLGPVNSQIQSFSIQGADYQGRSSLGTPTIGFFLSKGEFIHNASAVAGNTTPRGYVVTTAGVLAPNWVTSTAYLKGALVTAGGNVYASNGKFTSGTTPSGTGVNFLDTTATSINSGDVATWDFVAVSAVLAADSNIP